jgi:hypothetical protein
VSGRDLDREALIGRAVLDTLREGRAVAHQNAVARSAALMAAVLHLAHEDVVAGRTARGRAARVARKLEREYAISATRRHVSRLLKIKADIPDRGVPSTGV